jgi:hypothetical protein
MTTDTVFDATDLLMVREQVEGKIAALKNQIVSAVEAGGRQYGNSGVSGIVYAGTLVEKLRAYEGLFVKTNRELGRLTEGRLGTPA